MKRFHEAMARHSRGEKGQGMTEYIIIVAIIAIGAIIIVGLFGDAIRDRFNAAMAILMGEASYTDVANHTANEQVKRQWNNWEDTSGATGGGS